jgi:hypothetical protein
MQFLVQGAWTAGPALVTVVITTSLGTGAKGAIFGAAPADGSDHPLL